MFAVYMSGENISAEFEKVNPFKQVPAIDDDGFKLSERLKLFHYIVHCSRMLHAVQWHECNKNIWGGHSL